MAGQSGVCPGRWNPRVGILPRGGNNLMTGRRCHKSATFGLNGRLRRAVAYRPIVTGVVFALAESGAVATPRLAARVNMRFARFELLKGRYLLSTHQTVGVV